MSERFKLVGLPSEAWRPQLGWIYEQRPCREKGKIKLRLVELPDGGTSTTTFEATVPLGHIATYFETVREGR